MLGTIKNLMRLHGFILSTANTEGTNPEPDSYVTFNYSENVWTIGSLQRNVWSDATGF